MDKQQGSLAAAPRRRIRSRQALRALVTACAAAVVVAAGLLAEAFLPIAQEAPLVSQAAPQVSAVQAQQVAASRPAQAAPPAPPREFPPVAVADAGAAAAHAPADRHRAAKVAQRGGAPRSVAARETLHGSSRKVAVAVPARQATARVAPTPAWPDLQCDQSIPFAREVCKAVQCAKAEFSRHPVCVRMQADRRDREQFAQSMGAP